MLDSLQAGQKIRCTITKTPRKAAAVDTIERLMRQEPGVKRGLRRAQRRRRQDMIVYNRGNRDWYKREICGKQVMAKTGATWTMTYSLQILPELRSLASYVSVQTA
jgi:hypothetical protein